MKTPHVVAADATVTGICGCGYHLSSEWNWCPICAKAIHGVRHCQACGKPFLAIDQRMRFCPKRKGCVESACALRVRQRERYRRKRESGLRQVVRWEPVSHG